MGDFVELAEREQRADTLRIAKQKALRLIAPEYAGSRSHLLTKEQWRRFRASDDPLVEYPAETAQYVALYYDRIRRSEGWPADGADDGIRSAYEEEVGPYERHAGNARPVLASWRYWVGVALIVVASGWWDG